MHGYVWTLSHSVEIARIAYFPALICISIVVYRMLEQPARIHISNLFAPQR